MPEPPPSFTMESYVRHCSDMRDSEYEDIRKMAKVPEDDYMELAHYIWRLRATCVAVNRMVEAMIAVPSLKQIFSIKTVPAPAEMQNSSTLLA
jgi:hypothetical protein